MTELTKNRIKSIPIAVIVCVIGFFLLLYPSHGSRGISSGLTLCAEIVIPSLFPFLFLSSFIVKVDLCNKFSFIFEPFTKTLFKLPGCTAGAILMSLIGGFPVGAKMTYELYKNKNITKNQAKRMMLFCINPGPAFVINAVGYTMLGSSKIGVILFASICLSSILVGIVVSISDSKAKVIEKNNNLQKKENTPLSVAFTTSATDAASAMVSISVWVILFSCIGTLITIFPLEKNFIGSIFCFLEVTSGCNYAAKGLSVPSVGFILGWAGLCVHCQVLQYVKGVKCNVLSFFTARLACATLSSFICSKLLSIFPCEVKVFSSNQLAFSTAFSVSIPAVVAMLFMSAILILDLDTKRELC